MGGAVARAPVAMTARVKVSRRPSISSVARPVKRPSPRKTSTPSRVKRSAPSCGAIPARRRRIRSITAAKSTSTPDTPTPKAGVSRAVAAMRAAAIIAFDGTQPTFRQSPPRR